MYLLTIQTAHEKCSVSISENDSTLYTKESEGQNNHAAIVSNLVSEVIEKTIGEIKKTDAIAYCKGPGSYTGLRIGLSFAKGLCYSMDKPLIAINSLKAMANGFLQGQEKIEIPNNTLLCPMIDARRMEVYHALFNQNLDYIKETSALIVDEQSFEEYDNQYRILFFGNGAYKCKDLLTRKNHQHISFNDYSAQSMISLAYRKYLSKEFENLAYCEPFYLKDFIAIKAKNKVIYNTYKNT